MKNKSKSIISIIFVTSLILSVFGIILIIVFLIFKEKGKLKIYSEKFNKFIKESKDKINKLDSEELKKGINNFGAAFKEEIDKTKIEKLVNNPSNRIGKKVDKQFSQLKKSLSNVAFKKPIEKKKEVSELKFDLNLNVRQKNLLKFLEVKKSSEMKEISTKFKEVTQRTLRRDLDKLEELSFVKQSGSTRNSIYHLL